MPIPCAGCPDGSWYADNFDGVGFIDGLKAGGHQIAGRRILQVGAGGAGASLTYCLAEEGAAEIRLTDIDHDRAAKLAALVGKTFPKCHIEIGHPIRPAWTWRSTQRRPG
ncbi:hypothetical protein ACFSQT_23690 [Mesorhizobium calcicola]|uniref:Shikimate dehydrogenase n=1 Tax=Mesorhizobium calcicola TaxID=1300310 RepID=A0ABW4WIU4_9HYPH